ncbi:MAG: lipoyl synthase [Candidatus Omnitrophica bacterium]|jgi:lipoic acid synthetase|nr:lipoyl synthase [Candidatus Omnitrophota bacterium]
MDKPSWLNKKINLAVCRGMKNFLRTSQLRTVCEESFCPNISECFNEGVATFMILGDSCTRSCKFCAVNKETACAIDWNEPKRIAQVVKRLNLHYIVITSPARDDISDGGAELFYRAIEEIKNMDSSRKVEILIPDFLGNNESLIKVANSRADVISHNLETVPSLYANIRPQADYARSLAVLKTIKQLNRNIFTKSGIMLGLGEEEKQIINVFLDLRKADCDFLTLGQYLAPSLRHYPVKKYIAPSKFLSLEKIAYSLGFKKVKSSPYVRSSYLASQFLKPA